MIPPILVLPNPGWILLDEPRNITINGTLSNSEHSTHGYDPINCQDMRTIFYARGPAFKKGVTVEPFDSVNVYPLLAHLLGVKPRPNNGSLFVFKHILKDWDPNDEIELPGRYSKVTYGMIFIGGIILAILGMGLLYYLLTHAYRRCCLCFKKSHTNYARVSKMHFEDLNDEDQF